MKEGIPAIALILIVLLTCLCYFLVYSSYGMLSKLLIAVVTLLAAIFFGLLSTAYSHGLFKKLELKIETQPGRYFVYKCFQKDYNGIDADFDALDSTVRDNEVLSKYFAERKALLFGVYYDNPRIICDSSRARCLIGIAFDEHNNPMIITPYMDKGDLKSFVKETTPNVRITMIY